VVSPRVRAFLAEHNRDELGGVAWQLPFLQPRLVMLAPYLALYSLRRRTPSTAVPVPAQE